MIETLAVVGAFMVACGFAIQHAAYIIQYGSIFGGCREFVKHQCACSNPILRWLWTKLDELIHCQLCTITQLTLWWWTLPLAYLGYRVGVPLLWVVYLSTFAWFAQAAIALACWDLMRLVGRGTEALIQRARRS